MRVLTCHQEKYMKGANNVIIMYKGRVLGSGSFNELKDEGFFNTTVRDPLYKKLIEDNSDGSFVSEAREKHENAENIEGIVHPTDEPEGLKISEEDRAIGVVSSKLYWNYFRSGVPSLVVIAVFCLCVITQGTRKPKKGSADSTRSSFEVDNEARFTEKRQDCYCHSLSVDSPTLNNRHHTVQTIN